jgi:CRISPR-associated protein Csm2
MKWDKFIPETEITDKITEETNKFAKEFGSYLCEKENNRVTLSTNQLRKFFGEVKRQQMHGYDPTNFILLKPKLAYAVGRAKGNDPKIRDFYKVICDAIDKVNNEKQFKNFIQIFEAIVAYHKASENGANIDY